MSPPSSISNKAADAMGIGYPLCRMISSRGVGAQTIQFSIAFHLLIYVQRNVYLSAEVLLITKLMQFPFATSVFHMIAGINLHLL